MHSKRMRTRGSMTVEMTIILPVIMILILGILRFCILYYQDMMIATAAMQAAARGAAYWDVIGKNGADLEQGTGVDYTKHDPYRYLLDVQKSAKNANVKRYTEDLIGKKRETDYGNNDKLMEDKGTVTVEKTGNFLQKYVSVTVKKRNYNPLAKILRELGIAYPSYTTITARAPLNTPSEWVRNVSFVYDLVEEAKREK